MPDTRVVEIVDERDPLADAALALITDMFAPEDRQPLAELRSEIAERRLGMTTGGYLHLLAAVQDDAPEPAGVAVGVYLDRVNAGFISYLAVRSESRGRRIARILRPRLIEAFEEDAHRSGHGEPAWVLGEVRRQSPWLRRLVRTRGAIPFDLRYYHPGMGLHGGEEYVLYRQPLGDARRELPVALVRRVIYAIYRRAYRVRYPLQRDIFADMLRQLECVEEVGVHPAFLEALEQHDRSAQ
jgi:GNAT superfamily N-acetyltransferase